jgi:DNA-binding NarL/FixJ family response regulator
MLNAPDMIRLLLVDNQSLFCKTLKTILSLEPDLQVVGIADKGEMAIEKVAVLQPDVVLMDMQMPLMDGREAMHIIFHQFSNIKVLVLSEFNDSQYIAESILGGAKGYLLKDMPSKELIQAIRMVHRSYTQLAPGLMEKLLEGIMSKNAIAQNQQEKVLTQLTRRERDVLGWIGRGFTNREIATQLYIAEGTVKTHVTRLLNRLNFKNRSQLAIYANLAGAMPGKLAHSSVKRVAV